MTLPVASPIAPLAPVQLAMLRAKTPGADMEQAVLVFRDLHPPEEIEAAWQTTVEATMALGCWLSEDGWVPGAKTSGIVWHAEEAEPFEQWMEQDRMQPFPRTGEAPWRVNYWPTARRWVWSFPHALLDGRSIARVLSGFLRRLAGYAVADLPLAEWTAASAAENSAAEEFFSRSHKDVEPAVVDFGETGRARLGTELGSSLADALEAAAQSSGTTAATLVTWAWGQVLARASGVETLALGQVRSGPPKNEQAGFTMNTLPLVINRARDGKAAESWRLLREQMVALRAFETVAVEDLPMVLSPDSDTPWSSVIMVERGTMASLLDPEGAILLKSIEMHESSSGPMTAAAYLRPELQLVIETDQGMAAAESLLNHWAAVIQAATADPDGDASVITRLPEYSANLLTARESGGEKLPGPDHLAISWLESQEKHSSEIAMWLTDESWTYEEMGKRVKRVAAGLAAAGLVPGRAVAVTATRRCDWPVALLAISSLGGIYLPLDPKVPLARRRLKVENCQPQLLLAGKEIDDDFGLPRVDISGEEQTPIQDLGNHSEQQVLALIYTSGSTGTPKGVMLHHAGVLNEARWTARALDLKPGDRMLQFSSPGFDASLEEMLACLLSGATLVPRPAAAAEDFNAFQSFVESAGITVLDLPSAFWTAWATWLLENRRNMPASVRATIIGGERASARAMADWQAVGGSTLWNTYGPTETSIVATAQEIPVGWNESGDPPIGRPLPGTLARIADRHGTPMPLHAAGELWIGGPAVGPGYWGRAAQTSAAFQELEGSRWYRTGDRARWDPQGRLIFLGRIDDQLKIRGHRIEPEEVVRLVESFPGVASAYVGTAGPAEGPLLAAWVRWENEPTADWQATLRDHLAGQLPVASVPQLWAAVKEFPLTERGKLDRRALPDPLPLRRQAHEEPATEIEARLANLWAQLLGCSLPGRKDSFFDLGGNSLLAMRLFAGISTEFQVSLPMIALIQSPTLSGLAKVIETASKPGNAENQPGLVVLREGRSTPPLICVHGGDGGVFFYLKLAQALTSDVPVMGLESPALSASTPVSKISIEQLAADYLAVLRRYQAHGPYRLAGYSFGGTMVYEMAAQLRRAGEKVVFLGLFDTENLSADRREYRWAERIKVQWQALRGSNPVRKVILFIIRIVLGIRNHLQYRFENLIIRLKPSSRPYSRIRALQVREAHAAAMDAYKPPVIDVPVVLFKTQAVDDKFEVPTDYGWSALAPQLEIVEVGGEHLTMFSKRHAKALAKEVDSRI